MPKSLKKRRKRRSTEQQKVTKDMTQSRVLEAKTTRARNRRQHKADVPPTPKTLRILKLQERSTKLSKKLKLTNQQRWYEKRRNDRLVRLPARLPPCDREDTEGAIPWSGRVLTKCSDLLRSKKRSLRPTECHQKKCPLFVTPGNIILMASLIHYSRQ